MRQAVFVVAMVAAAFLGGAVVNGPGLRWVQDRLLDYLGVKDGEIASLDLPVASTGPADTNGPGAPSAAGEPMANAPSITPQDSAATRETPRAPAGGPVLEDAPPPAAGRPGATRPGARAARSSPEPKSSAQAGMGNVLGSLLGLKGEAKDSKKANAGSSPPSPSPAATADRASKPIRRAAASSETKAPAAERGPPADGRPKSTPAGSPGLDPPPESTPARGGAGAPTAGSSSGPAPAPLDPSVAPAILASLSPSGSSRSADGDRAAAEMIPLEKAPSSAGSPPPLGAGPGADSASWTALRRKLQAAGVTRYTIEGEPGGRVVFSCLIPLAGRQAVSQRFEAEGDDEFQAAQGAIRRIALWRATRQPPAQAR
jgi:hypothetical protein